MNTQQTERKQTLAVGEPPQAGPPEIADVEPHKHQPTRLSGAHAWLVVGAVVLAVLLVFIVQNAHSVKISFAGWSIHMSLAVALLLATAGGGLLVGAVGSARIAQLRRAIRRGRHQTTARL